MKKEIVRRKIPPEPGSRAKEREGIFQGYKLSMEDHKEFSSEFDEMAREYNKAPNPSSGTENLQVIIDAARNTLGSEYVGDPQRFTPEYHAKIAIQRAQRALKFIRKNDVEEAVLAATEAAYHDRQRFFAILEPELVRGLAQKPPSGGRKKQQWAMERARDLLARFPGAKFKELWNAIPEGEDEFSQYDGYEVWREGDLLKASGRDAKGGRERELSKEQFRAYVNDLSEQHSKKK